MTKEIYDRKLYAYKVSSASIDVKERAIAKLNAQFYGTEIYRRKDILAAIDAAKPELREGEYNI